MADYFEKVQKSLREATRERDSFTAGLEPGKFRGNKQDYELACATVEELERAYDIAIGNVDFRSYVGSLVRNKGDLPQAIAHADDAKQYALAAVLRAAMAPGTTSDTTWAKPLADVQTRMTTPVLGKIRAASLLGIPGLRRVPFKLAIPKIETGAGFAWVAENAPKPITKMAFSSIRLDPRKAMSIVVASSELLKFGGEEAKKELENEIAVAVIKGVNQAFLDAVAGDAARPAGLLNGVTPFDGTPNLSRAIADAIAALPQSHGDAVWIASRDARAVVGGQIEADGTLGGVVIHTVAGELPPNTLVLMVPSLIAYALDELRVDTAEYAALQLVDSGAVAGATQLVSLWQNNLTALRCEIFVNWVKGFPSAVQSVTLV